MTIEARAVGLETRQRGSKAGGDITGRVDVARAGGVLFEPRGEVLRHLWGDREKGYYSRRAARDEGIHVLLACGGGWGGGLAGLESSEDSDWWGWRCWDVVRDAVCEGRGREGEEEERSWEGVR